MAVYPGAIFRPLTVDKSRWRLVPLRMNLHVAVSEATSLFGYFNELRSRPDSHFYVRRDGTVEQYVDTALVAYADLEGNGSTISVETQGGVIATQTQKWTTAQVRSLAALYAWAVRTHGIAVQIADDSKPGKSSHGLSWHRLGCDGNFPARPLHGRVAGGRRYSRAFGKVCPGDAKIRQIPDIYDRAVGLLGGNKPTPAPTDREDDFNMSTPIKLSPAAQSALATSQETWTAGDLLAVLAHRIGLIHQRVEVLRDDSPKIKTAIQEIQELSRLLPRVADKVEKTNHATGRIEQALTTQEG